MGSNLEIILVTAEHLALTAAPGIAAALYAVRRGLRDVPLLLAVALAASGVVAFLSFWAYYADPAVGRTWGFLVLFASIQVVAMSVYRGGLDRRLLASLATPLALWALGSLFVVFLGFLHGGAGEAIGMSASRFSGPLPPDNDIPRFYADWFASNGHEGGAPPLYVGEWHMSDRPPLQVGYVLSQRPFVDTASNLHYQLLCVVVQSLWIVGMWAVLVAARLRRSAAGLAMLAMLVSDVAILHGFFVWPKLIAAAFVLAALALVVSPRWADWRRDPWVAALLGCLLALALLAHGSSVFGVIPLAVLAALRGLPGWRWIGVAALAGFVLMGSWTAYQRYADPPGDRLVKWHLGGELEVDDRGALETIVDGYGEAGLGGALENKWNNVEEMTGISRADAEVGGAADALGDGDTTEAIEYVRAFRFFALFPFLGLFLIAPVAMLLARGRVDRERPEWRFALGCFAFLGIGCLFWALIQWGTPGHSSTMIHAGTLAIPLVGIAGCVAGLAAVAPRLAAALVALNAAAVLLVYTPSLTPLPGTGYSLVAALLAAAGLAGFAAVAFGARPPRRASLSALGRREAVARDQHAEARG